MADDRVRRWFPALVATTLFAAMAALFATGQIHLYRAILTDCGVAVWPFPFLDTDTFLSAVRCLNKGVDVYVANPCDPLQRVYDYSPAWMVLTVFPMTIGWLTPIGLLIDAGFLLALALLPAGRTGRDTALITLGVVSSATAFALERGNNDLVLFALGAGAAALIVRSEKARWVGYGLIQLAGLLKYYPMAVMAVVARERPARFVAVAAASVVVTALFILGTWHDLHRALALIPTGFYGGDMFGSVEIGGGLQLKLGLPAGSATIIRLVACLLALVIATRLALRTDTVEALNRLTDRERTFFLIGALLILGCFFTAQNIGYRVIHLILALPALTVLCRTGLPFRFRAALPIALILLWAQGWRSAAERLGWHLGGKNHSRAVWSTWAIREPLWWWLVIILLSLVIATFLASPTGRVLFRRSERAG